MFRCSECFIKPQNVNCKSLLIKTLQVKIVTYTSTVLLQKNKLKFIFSQKLQINNICFNFVLK